MLIGGLCSATCLAVYFAGSCVSRNCLTRSLAAQDFNDLVPVMVEMGIGEQGKRKRSITYMGTKELAA